MPSPTRDARRREESARLLADEDAEGEEAVESAEGSNQNWLSRLLDSLRGSADPDDDRLLPTHYAKGRRSRGWAQWLFYLVFLVVGLGLGALITKSRGVKSDKGNGGFPGMPTIPWYPPPTGKPRNDAYLMRGTRGAVASEEVTCSNMGLSILRDKNGTAVDAAITTALCVGTLNAFASGIGGGGFMTIRVPEGARLPGDREREVGIWSIDFRETSPAKSDKWMYGENKAGRVAAQNGGLAIGVPGELRGLQMAHELYGSLPWKELVMPVAELAKGWQVSAELAWRIRVFGSSWMQNFPSWKAIYAPQGFLVGEGDTIHRLNYSRTLQRVAEHGASAFYEGEIARQSVKTIQSWGGIMDENDLKDFKAIRYPAIHQTYHDKTIYTTSAPTSGGVMMGLLNLLEPYNLKESGGLDTHLNVHRFIEALKFAFGARSEVCDPAFANDTSKFDYFYSKNWSKTTHPMITDDTTHDYSYYGLQHDTPVDKGTTHLSVVDQWGGAASVTSTVNGIWGSKVMDPETGVIFNNEQDDFAVPGAADQFGLMPSPWNYPAPGKKPLSSTAASIMLNEDGSLYAILGGSGGSRIFPAIAQVILNLESGYNLSAAIEKPRVHNQVVPEITDIEVGPEGEDAELSESLRAKNHDVVLFDINAARAEVQGILIENGTIWASSDSRKHGVAAAY